jgi:uncharacterized protein YhaN
MRGFGRFVGQEIKFADGLNLVYGENEAGKSTIHQFLRGMLFGFKRPDVSKRYFTDELERYRPWATPVYSGTLEYLTGNGDMVVIQRDFASDETKIIDGLTGADLTRQFHQDSRREYDFAEKHLGVGQTVFDHTICIAQLKAGQPVALGREVAGRLINLGDSHREDISVKDALKELDRAIESIGSDKATSKPLGRSVQRGITLASELSQADTIYQKIRTDEIQLNNLRAQLDDLENRQGQLKVMIRGGKAAILWRKWDTLKDMARRKNGFDTEADRHRAYSHFPAEIEEELTLLESRREQTVRDLKAQQASVNLLEEAVAELQTRFEGYPVRAQWGMETMRTSVSDYAQLKGLNEQIAQLQIRLSELSQRIAESERNLAEQRDMPAISAGFDQALSQNHTLASLQVESLGRTADQLERDYMHMRSIYVLGFRRTLAIVLMGILLSVAGYTWGGISGGLGIGGISLVGAGLAGWFWYQAGQACRKGHHALREGLEVYENEQALAADLEEKLNGYFDLAGANSLEIVLANIGMYQRDVFALTRDQSFLEQLQLEIQRKTTQAAAIEHMLKARVGDVLGQTDEFTDETMTGYYQRLESREAAVQDLIQAQLGLEMQTKRLDALTQEVNQIMEHISLLLDRAEVDSVNAFQACAANHRAYLQAVSGSQHIAELMQPYLAERDFSSWESLMASIDPVPEYAGIHENELADRVAELEALQSEYHEVQQAYISLQTSMETESKTVRDPVSIQEDIKINHDLTARLSMDLAILSTAKTMIQELSLQHHREFAPVLNEQTGKVVRAITNNRYQSVRVDAALNVLVESLEDQRQVPLHQLSGGTVDQIYFGLRMAIADLVSGQTSLPMILDDPFVQYSEGRLDQILMMLGEMAKERQIILFTCHLREGEVLTSKKINHHRIDLK